MAQSLNNLATLYRDQGKYPEAEPLFEKALAIAEKALGPEHPDVATGLNNLAELYRAQGRYTEAEPLYKRSLAIKEKALGPEHPHVATTLENYAALLRETARADEAGKMAARAREIRAKANCGIFYWLMFRGSRLLQVANPRRQRPHPTTTALSLTSDIRDSPPNVRL